MKTELVHELTATFEGHAQVTESGIEYWLARDLQHLLGYTKWDNFVSVVNRAKTACEVSGHDIADHFADVGKMVDIGSGVKREIDDIMLTRVRTRTTSRRERGSFSAAGKFDLQTYNLYMATSNSISIPVSADVAASFKAMLPARREALKRLLALRLEQAIKGSAEDLIKLMERASREAKTKGLTPEILQQILDER